VGTESDSVTVSITGNEATGAAGNLTAYNPIIIDNDTHDGDKRRTKLWEKDQEAQQRRKASLIATYEDLYEVKPKLVEDIVKSYTVKRDGRSTIDFDKLLANVDKVEALYREHQELDDEEVMLLL
jgi:4-alpha-glucanotransferase